MRLALALAERGRGRVSPNPLVGCVLVRDGAVVGEGWHARAGEAHAEVNALAAAGLPSTVRLYDLRHSMATLALMAGIHPKIVSERLGHATTKQTLDTYSHVTPHMQEQAGEQLASLIYGGHDRAPEVPVN